ncbi:MAG: sigma-70 family RNA polymerase sigma factor [Acidobacteria bacterium]|nr:sigma-70 family RNA polymerase sigma factor [Acidobacteriota bacterium]
MTIPAPPITDCLTDEALALAAQAGNRAAFTQLVERYSSRLYCFLRQKVRNNQDAEDLVQETFMRAFQKIRLYDSRWRFSTWLYTVAARLAVSHYRKHRERPVPAPVVETPPDPQDVLHRQEEAAQVWTLARDLNPDYFQLLWLRYQEEMPIKDIAHVVQRTRLQVRVQLHRARGALARKLVDGYPEAIPAESAGTRQTVSCG